MNNNLKKDLPLLSVLNNEIDGIIRWCTPSIHPRVPAIRGVYETDISISYHSLGNPSLNTGIFLKAHKKAAKAYKAEHTLFSVNGSTGSNFIVLRSLKHQLGKIDMLAQRNIHKSISVAIEDYGINVEYLQPHYDNEFQIFIPNPIEEIISGLKAHPEINVLFVTNPTYEGLSLDLKKLVKEVRKVNHKIIIFVDEAWGSHFSFSEKLPHSAMEAGVDICVQSTHKQGSGLQQTSMIHWRGGRINKKYVMDSYKSIMTTSPSFHLLASLDAARYLMEKKGKQIIDDLVETSDLLRTELRKIKGVMVVDPNEITKKHKQVTAIDSTKVLANVEKTGILGFDIAHHLEKDHKVVVEKYEANNILFLCTFQNNKYEVNQTVESLKEVIKSLSKSKEKQKINFPEFPTKIIRKIPSYLVNGSTFISKIEDSVGKVSGEDVVPYPPGIPLIVKGEVVQNEHVDYLFAIKKTKNLISVVMNDDNIKYLVILNQKEQKI